MEKVIVIGCPGAGKSTFAKQLQPLLDLPLYHLDQLNWLPDKTTVSKEQFVTRLDTILRQACWLIDGNYGATIERRLRECDTIFWLDYDEATCLQGISERIGMARSDMPWVETEVDPELVAFVKNYSRVSRPQLLALQATYSTKNWIVFKTRQESAAYLQYYQQVKGE